MANTVAMSPSGLPAKNPTGVCDGCGALGTVGVAHRRIDGVMVDTHIYCAQCWPEHQARLEARWKELSRLATEQWLRREGPRPPSMALGFESATWHATLQLVERLNEASRRPPAPTVKELQAIAASIASARAEMVGLAAATRRLRAAGIDVFVSNDSLLRWRDRLGTHSIDALRPYTILYVFVGRNGRPKILRSGVLPEHMIVEAAAKRFGIAIPPKR